MTIETLVENCMTAEIDLLRQVMRYEDDGLGEATEGWQQEQEKERSLQTAVFPSPLLTSKEAADYLRICQRTIRTTCREEGLIPILIGNKFLYRQSDLDRFIEMKAEEQRQTLGRNLDIPSFKG